MGTLQLWHNVMTVISMCHIICKSVQSSFPPYSFGAVQESQGMRLDFFIIVDLATDTAVPLLGRPEPYISFSTLTYFSQTESNHSTLSPVHSKTVWHWSVQLERSVITLFLSPKCNFFASKLKQLKFSLCYSWSTWLFSLLFRHWSVETQCWRHRIIHAFIFIASFPGA